MNLAALPDHNRIDDPLWVGLFHRYRHIITPLRANGWITDVELCGGEYHLRADLGDGTELIIAASHALPTDPAEVDGWQVVRQSIEAPHTHTVLYNATPEGPQRHHGTNLVPLLARLDELDACTTTERLSVTASSTTPHGVPHNQSGPVEKPGTALARYFDWARVLIDDGYHRAWERAEEPHRAPLAIFENEGHVTTIRITRWDK